MKRNRLSGRVPGLFALGVWTIAALAGPARAADPRPAQEPAAPSGSKQAEPTSAAKAPDGPPPPPRHLIAGVPWMSWDEAEKLRFDPTAFANPSGAASVGMVLGYYGEDLKRLESGADAMPRGEAGWARTVIGSSGTFDELKRWIARDVPVVVSCALVPDGQPLVWTGPFYIHFTGIERPRSVRTSGSLGPIFTPEAYRSVGKAHQVPLNLTDGRFFTGKVVIGYDDAAGTVTLHDPSFGPAWEVPRAEFDTMWSISDNSFVLLQPRKPAAARPAGEPYPERTTDQKAAELYSRAYAASAQGYDEQTIQLLNKGLALPALPASWRHLMLLERGCRLLVENHVEDAISDLESSRDMIPEDFRSWLYLSEALRFRTESPAGEALEEVLRVKGNAGSLCRDPKSDRALAAALPGNLPFFGCSKPLP